MKIDYRQPAVEISPMEQEELRKDIWQGLIAGFVMLLIAVGFSCMFYTDVPQDTMAGKLFVWVPLLVISLFFLIAIYTIYNYWRDLQYGLKHLISGIVQKKYIRVTTKMKGSTFTNLSERTRHFIVVDGKSYLIKGGDFEQCSVDQCVDMYVGKYSNRVFDLYFAGWLKVEYSS